MKIKHNGIGWYIFGKERKEQYLLPDLSIYEYPYTDNKPFPYFKTKEKAEECLRKYKEKTNMLDKTKIYAVCSGTSEKNAAPSKHFRRVKILFEDDISFYVESLTVKDASGFGRRYSVKKHCFILFETKKEKTGMKVGDKIQIWNTSYSRIVKDGKIAHAKWQDVTDKSAVLIAVDCVLPGLDCNDLPNNAIVQIRDTGQLIFTRMRFLTSDEHTVSFDGGEPVTISDKSFQALKQGLTG